MNDPAAPDSRPPEQTAPDVSLVICTYNRADLLTRALESACRQAVHPSRYEILVVDNNSTDHTRDVVARLQRDHANLRYLHETRVGLSHARNRGWQEARGPYVAYTDDDCILPPHWLSVALEIIAVHNPEAFGGPYRAFYLTAKPAWFKDSYGSRSLGDAPRTLGDREFLSGGNMAFQRAVLNRLDGFDSDYGMAGMSVGYGEEGHLQRRLRSIDSSAVIYYDPRMVLHHLVRDDHMTWNRIVRGAIAKGRSGYLLGLNGRPVEPISLPAALMQAAKVFAVFAADSVRGIYARDRQAYPYYQNYLYERVLWRLGGLGRIRTQRQNGGGTGNQQASRVQRVGTDTADTTNGI